MNADNEDEHREWMATKSATQREAWLGRRWGQLAKFDFCESCFLQDENDDYHDPVHSIELNPNEPGLFVLTCSACGQSHLQEVGQEEFEFYLDETEEYENE